MAATITREVAEADRYLYDFGLCRDFAQVDTGSDAAWFGIWACPRRRVVFTYCEGDCTTVECETDADFRAEMLKVRDWHNEHDTFHGVDPGTDPEAAAAWQQIGLGELLRG